MALAEADPQECRRDVELAKDAGLDLLRIHGHVARPETYEAADQAGMLLWQDFPLQWGYARQIRWQATRQAAEMVALLGHHPSVAVWCGHNEPMRLDIDAGQLADRWGKAKLGLRVLASQQLPTWNKTVLDRSVKRAIERTDGTRPVVPHSGVLPHLPDLRGTDSHLYFGWYFGREGMLPAVAKWLPSLVRFPTEFGAQAVPETDDFVGAGRWPDLDWERLESRHSLQRPLLERFVPPDGHGYESWKEATQRYQATVVRHHVETLRRLKYRPTGGFAQFCFADGYPGITWSVLDHERRPKLAHAALVAACRPVIAVADRIPDPVRPGRPLALDVHVVSDRRMALSGRLDVTLSWDGGGHRWRFEGEVPADSCVRVGTVQFEVPDVTGELVLHLSGDVGDDRLDSEYRARVVRVQNP
jgi:beta-mannosidase